MIEGIFTYHFFLLWTNRMFLNLVSGMTRAAELSLGILYFRVCSGVLEVEDYYNIPIPI